MNHAQLVPVPPGLAHRVRGGVLFALEDFTKRGLRKHPEALSCTSRLSVWVGPRNQSVVAKPLDQILIRKIRFGKKNKYMYNFIFK